MQIMTKTEAMAEIKKWHDIIKAHPFRDSFDPKWERDYMSCLYKLSDLWGKYAYFGAHESDEEKRLLGQSGYWMHNYNQQLLRRKFPMEYVGYYEQMLQVMHRFADTGEMPAFYDIGYLWKDGRDYRKVERYELVTSEMCGIESSVLPQYLPVDYTIECSPESVRKYMEKNFPYCNMTEEERDDFYQRWLSESKPVIDWVNAGHEETEFKHSVWVAVKTQR